MDNEHNVDSEIWDAIIEVLVKMGIAGDKDKLKNFLLVAEGGGATYELYLELFATQWRINKLKALYGDLPPSSTIN